jgi:pimeloyl-ACP methyl ester carboxylesterase
VELPRRPFLGVALEGRRITRVLPGSCAEEAGLRVGDELLAIDGESELRAALATVRDVIATTNRGDVRVRLRARPAEDGASYEHVVLDGVRLRTIVRRASPSRGSVLFLQGISLASIETSAAARALCTAWSDAGFTSMRVEKRGVGDSEGDLADFDAELAGARAAFDALSAPVFVFGHSVGGMIAPLLDRSARGTMVYGTAATRWTTCVAASTRRQLQGRDEATIAAAVDAQLRGMQLGDERSPAFHAQLDGADLAGAWRAIDHPVLVLHGTHDLVVGHDEARAIASLAPCAELRLLEGLDHSLARRDLGSPLVDSGCDPAIIDATIAWMRAHG